MKYFHQLSFFAFLVVALIIAPQISSAGGAGNGSGGGGGGTTYNPTWSPLHGFASSESSGLMGINCTDLGGCVPFYRVDIDTGRKNSGGNGELRGNGLFPTLGYVSFDKAKLGGCPQSPCTPQVNWNTGKLSGWACLLDLGTGTCKEWISLSCANTGTCAISNYGVSINKDSGLLSGYALGNSVTTGGLGWIDFSGVTASFVTSFACYLPDQYGRKMVSFNGNAIGYTPPSTNRLYLQASALDENKIPAGFYKITLATYDNHTITDTDWGEQWHLIFNILTGDPLTTDDTPDLPSYTSYAESVVNDQYVLEADSGARSIFNGVYTHGGVSDPLNPNYDNGFAPVCAAFDYICPFNEADAPGRRVVYFTDDQGDLPTGRGAYLKQGEPLDVEVVNIPAGTYYVSMATYDNHSARSIASPTEWGDGDGPEAWALKACSGTTGCGVGSPGLLGAAAGPDIPATADFAVDGQTITVSQPVQSISLGPLGGSTGYRATALCAAFDPITPPTVTLTPTPGAVGTPPAVHLTPNSPLKIDWNISGDYDSCTFTSNIPDADGNGTPDQDSAWNAQTGVCPGASCVNPTGTFNKTLLSSGTYQYLLTCQNQGASSPSVSVSIQVLPPATPLTVDLTPAVQGIPTGQRGTISWTIGGDYAGGCETTSNGTDSGWDNLADYGRLPYLPVSSSYLTQPLGSGIRTYVLACKDRTGKEVTDTAIINVPPECSDNDDNDHDGYIDAEDRGCWTDLTQSASYSATDNSESGEPPCVVDAICQVKYGENPISCTADCRINSVRDQ